MKRKIQWQFWKHPLSRKDEWVDEELYDPADDDEDEEDDDDAYDHDERAKARVAIPTAVGLIPVQPYQDMNEAFDFWMGHTNFSLGAEEVEAIESHPGVETLDVLTRYRFRVGIGHAFRTGGDSSAVRRGLEEALLVSIPRAVEENPGRLVLTPDMQERVDVVRAAADEANPYWALIVLPNGGVDCSRGSDKEVVTTRLKLYRDAQRAVGGVIWNNVDPNY